MIQQRHSYCLIICHICWVHLTALQLRSEIIASLNTYSVHNKATARVDLTITVLIGSVWSSLIRTTPMETTPMGTTPMRVPTTSVCRWRSVGSMIVTTTTTGRHNKLRSFASPPHLNMQVGMIRSLFCHPRLIQDANDDGRVEHLVRSIRHICHWPVMGI